MLHSDKDFLEKYKIRKTIKRLKNARGSGTSMISLLLRAGQQLSLTTRMLQEEYGTASNIKSRVNRQSVQTAIVSALERLKLYSQTPPNGLVLYCGLALDSNGKEKKLTIDFEPYKPLTQQMYYCDNRFHTELLEALLEPGDLYGYVVISGQDALIGQVSGQTQEVLRTFSVELPKKHHKGGQSAMRYSRLRVEKRAAFVRKTVETVNKLFIEADGSRAKVKGLVAAGPASLKNDFAEDSTLDGRLKSVILKVVDTAQGGNEGFREAVEATQEMLQGVKLKEEGEAIVRLLDEYRKQSGLACVGAKHVVDALEAGACKEIIVSEELDWHRCKVRFNKLNFSDENSVSSNFKPHEKIDNLNKVKIVTGEAEEPGNGANLGEESVEVVKFFRREKIQKRNWDLDGEIVEKEKVVDIIVDSVKCFDSDLAFVSEKTTRGKQFIRTFGGVGAILKYKMEFSESEEEESE